MSTLVDATLKLATNLHSGQVRKFSGAPYIIHPMKVTERLMTWGVTDEVMLASAYLHDVIEDCGAREISIINGLAWDNITFSQSKEVSKLVNELTHYNTTNAKPGSQEYRDYKHAYMQSFSDKSIAALIIKVADRLENIKDFIDESFARDGCVHDGAYAVKYYRKAQPLWDALYLRMEEIDVDIFCRMTVDLHRVEGALQSVQS